MNFNGILALTSKDFFLYFKNRFFAVVTIMGIVAYLVIYFLMPAGVNDTLEVGVYVPSTISALETVEQEGLTFHRLDTEQALQTAVKNGKYVAGIAFPRNFSQLLPTGQKPPVTIYFSPDTPEMTRSALNNLVQGWAYGLTGSTINISISEEILGRNVITGPVPPRDRLRPLFAVFLIMTETLGLASLITEEIENHTIRALLVSPMNIFEIFVSKGITGVSLAFGQAVLFMTIVGGMSRSPGVVLVSLFLGSVMLTGVGFLIASVARDTLSVMAWGVLALIIMIIPSVAVIFPGSTANWIKVIPSYYLINSVHLGANFGAGWGNAWTHFLALAIAGVVISGTGILSLQRRFK